MHQSSKESLGATRLSQGKIPQLLHRREMGSPTLSRALLTSWSIEFWLWFSRWKYLTQCARGFQHGTAQACMVWDIIGGSERKKPDISLHMTARKSVPSAKEHLQTVPMLWLLEKKQLPPELEPGTDPVQMIREYDLRLNLSNPGADALSNDVLANTQGWWQLSFSSYYQHWKSLD